MCMVDIKRRMPNPAFDHGNDFVVKTEDSIVEEKKSGVKKSKSRYTFAELAIGKDSRRFIAIFKKIIQGKFFITSTPAGIFGLAWLIYRRASVYGFSAYLLLIFAGYEIFTSMSFLPKELQFVLIFALTHAVFFFVGNFIYFCSVRSKITKFRSRYGDTSAMTYLSEQGGTLSGFNLITPIILLQGGMVMVVFGCLYVDDFLISLWSGFLELAHLQ